MKTVNSVDSACLFSVNGTSGENAQEQLEYFTRYITFRQTPEYNRAALFALLMRDAASTWY